MVRISATYFFLPSPKIFPDEREEIKLDADRIQFGGILKRLMIAFFTECGLRFPVRPFHSFCLLSISKVHEYFSCSYLGSFYFDIWKDMKFSMYYNEYISCLSHFISLRKQNCAKIVFKYSITYNLVHGTVLILPFLW